MDQEILFARTLEQVKRTAREQGSFIKKEQVEEAFAGLDLSEEQMALVYDYLTGHKIGIGEPLPQDEYLSDLSEKEKNYLQNYLDELEQLHIYTDGEKRAYTIAAMAGETDAQNRLVEIYLRDVVDIAKLYTGQGVFLEDLIGEGNVALAFGTGMLGSLEKPEEADGMLVKLIMDAMEEFIKDNTDSDKVNKRALDRVNKVMDKAKEYSESIGRKVTVAELSEETGMSEKTIRDAMRISGFKIDYIEG